MLFIIKDRFFRTKEVGTISSLQIEISKADTNRNFKKAFLNYNPKTIICEAQAKEA